MKIPVAPPKFDLHDVLSQLDTFRSDTLHATTAKGEYLHWDKLRHLSPPDHLSATTWWFATKLARKTLYKTLPFVDKYQIPFVLAIPDPMIQQLHILDSDTRNVSTLNNPMKETYIVHSLTEEAITSSQLEGASTTRQVAKEMLRTQRKPRNTSETMILNNYQAMQFIRDIKNHSLTIDMILELHRILTKETLDEESAVGQLRTSDDVHIWDNTDQVLHTPPAHTELTKRLQLLCKFANATDESMGFIHPIIRAILLHFMLAYDHPFIDGNGRTARALFYWSMAHQGYWLMEFISISQIIKKAPGQYARAYLYTETDENDTTYFIMHQLEVISLAICTLHDYIRQKNQQITETEQLIYANHTLQNKLNYRQISLIIHALENPHTRYQIEGHRQSHHITYQTARTDLLKLAQLELLIQQKIGKAFTFITPADLKKRLQNH